MNTLLGAGITLSAVLLGVLSLAVMSTWLEVRRMRRQQREVPELGKLRAELIEIRRGKR